MKDPVLHFRLLNNGLVAIELCIGRANPSLNRFSGV